MALRCKRSTLSMLRVVAVLSLSLALAACGTAEGSSVDNSGDRAAAVALASKAAEDRSAAEAAATQAAVDREAAEQAAAEAAAAEAAAAEEKAAAETAAAKTAAAKTAAAEKAASEASFDKEWALKKSADILVDIRTVDEYMQDGIMVASALNLLSDSYGRVADAGTPPGLDESKYMARLLTLQEFAAQAADEMTYAPMDGAARYAVIRKETGVFFKVINNATGSKFRLP